MHDQTNELSIKNSESTKPVRYLKIRNKGINSIVKRMDNKLFFIINS